MSTTLTAVHVAGVCRVQMTESLLSLARNNGPGIVQIPDGMLEPRQIKMLHDEPFTAIIKWHRDTFISCVNRINAEQLVDKGLAEYMPQSLLIYDMEDYKKDPDVRDDPEEVKKLLWTNAELVIVAVIGENRSPVSVCRNIVSGVQDMHSLREDAMGAIEASRVFLIED